MTDRRSFLRGLLAAGVAAPAIVHDIIRVKTMLWTPRTNLFVGTAIYDGDAEIGSAANPWRTIQQAIDYVTREIDFADYPPVTINVGEGTFDGFSFPNVGRPAFVTVRGIGQDETTILQHPVTRRCVEFLAPNSVLELESVELRMDKIAPKDGGRIVALDEDGFWHIEGKKP